ncbi:MAG: sulfotransferase [Candidatus Promineofilum sp.]|nr:sulfotransferase [Promineifilum sp.]
MITSPVLIIGCARSGTTLLYNVLSEVDELWSLGYESREIIERRHGPAARGWESGALSAADLADARAPNCWPPSPSLPRRGATGGGSTLCAAA